MPWNKTGNSRRNGGAPHQPRDLDELLNRSKDKLKQAMPRGPGLSGPVVFTAFVLLAAIVAYFPFTFRVDPDERGVVMRFGKPIRQEPPGLHLRMPYPIDEVRLPKVTRQNIIEVGMRTAPNARGASGTVTSVREESLMLSGDENIVDVNFVVFWRIQDATSYLFNIQNQETTVKAVAESAMREVVGKSDIQPLLTAARQEIELAVQTLMQSVLDQYGAGVHVDQVRLQKADPPAQVIDAFRDVQAAATDKERLQNEAGAYANRIVPEARGEAERILQGAAAYKEQTVAEATGQSARFLKIYQVYRNAPQVTRTRMYLETMERVLGGTEKIIIDTMNGQGVVPFLSLNQSRKDAGR
jgi:membrane protease subunit HflK